MRCQRDIPHPATHNARLVHFNDLEYEIQQAFLKENARTARKERNERLYEFILHYACIAGFVWWFVDMQVARTWQFATFCIISWGTILCFRACTAHEYNHKLRNVYYMSIDPKPYIQALAHKHRDDESV